MKRTPAQIEASRANGAKSKGPTTIEGRTRSSRNAIKHGLAAHKIVVLDGESEEEWYDFRDGYLMKFQPRDPVEEHLILEMAVNRWRLQRAWALQTATIDGESAKPALFGSRRRKDKETIQIHARCHNSRRDQLESLSRQETRLTRNFDRAFRNLTQMRKQFPPVAPIQQNEPETTAIPERRVETIAVTPQIVKSQNEPETVVNSDTSAKPGPSRAPQYPGLLTEPRPAGIGFPPLASQNDSLSAN
jgi:hypothetical protein